MKRSVIRIAVISTLALLLCVGIGLAISYQTTESSNQVFKTEHVWDAKVTIGDHISISASKNGERHIVPILGSTFKGPKIRGEVLPLGEDWQLVYHDGDMELYARYLLNK